METKKWGIAVIGAGQIAKEHVEKIQKTQRLELRAICDSNLQAAHGFAAQYSVPESSIYTDYKKVIADPNVDAVIITAPNILHYPIALEAITANKPYYLEKPVSMNAQQAKTLEEETAKRHLPNMVGFSYRFYPALRYAHHIVDSGAIGEVHHFYASYLQGLPADLPCHWRYQKDIAGTGTLGDLGSHTLDTARFLAGEFESVLAHGGIFIKERPDPAGKGMLPVDTDDYFHILAKLQSGAAATFAFSKFCYGRMNYQRFEMYGTKGAIVYNQEKGVDTIELCSGDIYKEHHQFATMDIPKKFNISTMEGFERILSGGDRLLAADITDGWQVQRILDATVESGETGSWVDIR